MNGLALLAAGACGVGAAGAAAVWRPPTRALGPRVRPYAIVARSALGHPTVLESREVSLWRAVTRRMSRAIEARGDDRLALSLRQAGHRDVTPEQYRVRQLGGAASYAGVAAVAAAVVAGRPIVVLAAAIAGFTVGATRERRRLDRAIAHRCERIRLELYTVNQLVAVHVRAGAGVLQAVQRVVTRGRGVVVEELSDVLVATRRGLGEAEAFRRAAELTPEPGAARTYRLLATGSERGVDLGRALLALSADLRDARREALHKDAVRRRAAMLVPTIAILAPIMLLFIAAPLPSIVLGHR